MALGFVPIKVQTDRAYKFIASVSDLYLHQRIEFSLNSVYLSKWFVDVVGISFLPFPKSCSRNCAQLILPLGPRARKCCTLAPFAVMFLEPGSKLAHQLRHFMFSHRGRSLYTCRQAAEQAVAVTQSCCCSRLPAPTAAPTRISIPRIRWAMRDVPRQAARQCQPVSCSVVRTVRAISVPLLIFCLLCRPWRAFLRFSSLT